MNYTLESCQDNKFLNIIMMKIDKQVILKVN